MTHQPNAATSDHITAYPKLVELTKQIIAKQIDENHSDFKEILDSICRIPVSPEYLHNMAVIIAPIELAVLLALVDYITGIQDHLWSELE